MNYTGFAVSRFLMRSFLAATLVTSGLLLLIET